MNVRVGRNFLPIFLEIKDPGRKKGDFLRGSCSGDDSQLHNYYRLNLITICGLLFKHKEAADRWADDWVKGLISFLCAERTMTSKW